MTDDHVLREQPEGYPLLDNDGIPMSEIAVDNVDDAFVDHGVTLQELAAGQRAWRFGHVIVDEAQDLTPMQWRMITRRARGGSMTIVGDLAQRSIGEPGSWRDHLPETVKDFSYQELTINYRSPAEVNDLASAVLAELAPELAAPQSIRTSGYPPTTVRVDDIDQITDVVLAERMALPAGQVAVIGASESARFVREGVQWLSAWKSKGLEFDSVIVVEPAQILEQPNGLSLLYVALTRTTSRLTIVHQQDVPEILAQVLNAPPT